VVVVRKTGPFTTQTLATQNATTGQTHFDLSFSSPGLLAAGELFGFVVPRFVPLDPPKLEIGAATGLGAIEAAGGTFRNYASGITGTALLVRLRKPDGTPVTASVQLTVTGPGGWNANQPLMLNYPAGLLRQFYSLTPAPVSGTYEVDATIDGSPHSDQFEVNAAVQLGSPATVVADLVGTPGAVGASWSAVSGAGSYLARVFDVGTQTILTPVAFTNVTSATLNGVPINGGGQKALQVFAFSNNMTPADPPVPDSFDISFDRTILTGAVTVSPVSASVAADATQGLTATVVGFADTAVTWSATGGGLAPSGNTAQWTAPSTPGTYTVTATSVANSAFRARSTLTVPGSLPCTVAAIAQRFNGPWFLTAFNVVATAGAQNCSTVPEFVAFLNGGTLAIGGGGPGGTLTLSNGLQGYPGEFFCNGDDGGFSNSSGNFSLDYDPPMPEPPPVPEKIGGQLTLRLPGTGIVPCVVVIEAER
jgi:hypothetical protein